MTAPTILTPCGTPDVPRFEAGGYPGTPSVIGVSAPVFSPSPVVTDRAAGETCGRILRLAARFADDARLRLESRIDGAIFSDSGYVFTLPAKWAAQTGHDPDSFFRLVHDRVVAHRMRMLYERHHIHPGDRLKAIMVDGCGDHYEFDVRVGYGAFLSIWDHPALVPYTGFAQLKAPPFVTLGDAFPGFPLEQMLPKISFGRGVLFAHGMRKDTGLLLLRRLFPMSPDVPRQAAGPALVDVVREAAVEAGPMPRLRRARAQWFARMTDAMPVEGTFSHGDIEVDVESETSIHSRLQDEYERALMVDAIRYRNPRGIEARYDRYSLYVDGDPIAVMGAALAALGIFPSRFAPPRVSASPRFSRGPNGGSHRRILAP